MINHNETDIKDIDFNISVEECFKELKPHPKFKNCTFDNYNNDINYPSQLELKNILRNISIPSVINHKGLLDIFFKPKKSKVADNLYIDGTYGIGKTHLLSACFNNFNGTKAFLSFLELTYFINYTGLEKCIEQFKKLDLLLIDEFDLDDPATTRMAARLISELNHHTTIITTSNRLPKELGGTNFDTGMFARELGIIADSFRTIEVLGVSFRINLAEWQKVFSENAFLDAYNVFQPQRSKMMINMNVLMKALQDNHPFRFFVIPKSADAIFIDNFEPFQQLNDALRFSIFIDHCYYHDTKIFFKTDNIKDEIFPKSMMETTFERQFLRCRSRIEELGMFFKS